MHTAERTQQEMGGAGRGGGSLAEDEMRIFVAAQTPGGSKCDHNLLMDSPHFGT